MKMNLQDVMRGIALIETGLQNPAVKAAIVKLLPSFGLTPDEIAQLDSHHDDYQRWLAEAQQRASQ